MSLEAYVQIATIFVAFITGAIFLRSSLRDIRGEIKDVRGEVQAVHTKIETVRTELKKDIEAVRSELKKDIEGVRIELKEDIQGVRTKVDGVQQQVAGQGERLARIEGMLTPQNGRYSAQEEAVSAEQSLPPQPRAARPA